jgi:hypothetical protein
MEQMSQDDYDAIMNVVMQGMFQIMKEAQGHLSFPIKVTATCPGGLVMAFTIPTKGAEPVVSPLREEVAMVTFPITVICIGQNNGKVTGTIEQPQRHTEGNA